MSYLDPYYAKHGAVVEHLALAAEQIPENLLDWKPYEKALPWLRLIDHTSIGRRMLVLRAIQGKPLDAPACFHDTENHAKGAMDAAKAQRESWDELMTYLKSQPDDFAKKKVTFTRGREMTVEQILWFAYEENVHHRGQAWIYARLNGLTPPKVWGTEIPD